MRRHRWKGVVQDLNDAYVDFRRDPTPRGKAVQRYSQSEQSPAYREMLKVAAEAGLELFKLRTANSDARRGARYGLRIIVGYDRPRNVVYLLRIYDKTLRTRMTAESFVEPLAFCSDWAAEHLRPAVPRDR